VPVTSYYWHLAFGGILAALTTAVGDHVRTTKQLLFALPAALFTIVLGVAAFLPLHGLAAIGVSHGVVVASALALCLAVLLGAPKRPETSPDALLVVIAATFYAFHAVVVVGAIPVADLVFVFAAIAFALAVNLAVHKPALMRAKGAATS
jgi:hypothetical protein